MRRKPNAKPKKKSTRAKTTRAVSRAPRPQKVSYLFDQGVPLDLLFNGVLPRQTGAIKPHIRLGTGASPSPFVIHLNAELPSINALLAEQDMRRVRVNFAVPEKELFPASLSPLSPAPLHLDAEETMAQLQENDLTRTKTPSARAALPVRLPTLSDIEEAIRAFRLRRSIWEPAAEIFDPSRLIPKRPQTHTIPFELDLPEAEEGEDESDVLTLDELTGLPATTSKTEKPSPWKLVYDRWRLFEARIRMPSSFLFFELPKGWHRAIAAFVLVSFAFVLPLHAVGTLAELRAAREQIESASARGLLHLQTAANAVFAQQATQAVSAFGNAENNFEAAGQRIRELGASTLFLLSTLPHTRTSLQSAKHLLAAGEGLAEAGKRVSDGLARLDTPAAEPTTKLNVLASSLSSALPLLKEALENVKNVDEEAIPSDKRPLFDELSALLPTLVASIEDVGEFSAMASTLLGDNGRQRYLLVFQNNAELRPTGGFMGSFAHIDLVRGAVQNMEIPGGGSYDLKGSLKTSVAAPKPLQLLNARWEFQDANWFSDFPTSARQILDFYADAGGPSVDGVIAVNATFIMELLSAVGPVDMPEYDRVIDADNFLFETQKIVEFEYAQYAEDTPSRKEAAPKAFIGDLAQKLLERINALERDELLSILTHINTGLMRKDVQLYLENEDLESTIQSLGWGGEVKQVDGDYLQIVDTNLGGGKTDGVIKQDVDLTVAVQEDGSIVNTLKISRTHNGIRNTLFTGVNNVDYVRVYVPKGSTLLSASGFSIPDASLFERPEHIWVEDPDIQYLEDMAQVDAESGTQISEEFGKTVYGNWVQTKPATTSTVTFVYRLPFTLEKLGESLSLLETLKARVGLSPIETYTLTVQKQSGVLDRTTRLHLEIPDYLRTLWRSAEGETVEFTNETDMFWGALLERTSL